MGMLRTRWAAIGAAVAVTLGAGGISFVDAAKGSGDRPVTVTIDPCRLRDTRPTKGVGGRTAALGPAETYTIPGTGPSGNCNIPADATGLVLNVTADQATEATNLRLYPADAAIPTTSNLNPRPGAAPTPNAVTVGLDNSGQFVIRNAKGLVHVIIDVTAYLVDHHHDDRYYKKSKVDEIAARPFVAESDTSVIDVVAGSLDPPSSANTLTVNAPGPGQLLVVANGVYSALLSEGLHPSVRCSLTDDGAFDAAYLSRYEVWNATPTGGNERSHADLSLSRVIDVPTAGDVTLDLLCRRSAGRVLLESRIIAQYVP